MAGVKDSWRSRVLATATEPDGLWVVPCVLFNINLKLFCWGVNVGNGDYPQSIQVNDQSYLQLATTASLDILLIYHSPIILPFYVRAT